MHKMLSAALLVFSLGICAGQQATGNPLEPQVFGTVYLIDNSTQTLKALPGERWKDELRGNHALAASKVFNYIRISGASSPFRIKAGEKVEFVFKMGDPENVALYRLEQKKKERLADYAVTDSQSTREQIPGLVVEFTRFGHSAYKLVPSAPLAPGEYMIYDGDQVFTFGVDQ